LQALINTGQKLVDGLIWFGLYCLPFLLPLGLVVYFITKAMTKRRRERKAREFMEVKPVSRSTPPEKPQI
jgi:cytochrome c biogenesis protein CcdA